MCVGFSCLLLILSLDQPDFLFYASRFLGKDVPTEKMEVREIPKARQRGMRALNA